MTKKFKQALNTLIFQHGQPRHTTLLSNRSIAVTLQDLTCYIIKPNGDFERVN